MTGQIVVTAGFDDSERSKVAELFWNAFRGKMHRFMGPDHKARTFFASILNPDFALTARSLDGDLLGVAGFKTSQGALAGGDLKDLQAVYGYFGGLWRGLILSFLERDVSEGVLLMDGIFVAQHARGSGVGTQLLRSVLTAAERRGDESVRLDVIDSNPRAKALYEREGFVPAGTTNLGPLRYLFGFDHATTMICRL